MLLVREEDGATHNAIRDSRIACSKNVAKGKPSFAAVIDLTQVAFKWYT
jgi:hypothetical protein